jgi:hypothetical protein
VERSFKSWRKGENELSAMFNEEKAGADTRKMRRVHVTPLLSKLHRCKQLLDKVAAARKTMKIRSAARAADGAAAEAGNEGDDDEQPIADRSSPPLPVKDEAEDADHRDAGTAAGRQSSHDKRDDDDDDDESVIDISSDDD